MRRSQIFIPAMTAVIACALIVFLGRPVSMAASRDIMFGPAPGERTPAPAAWLYVIGINDYKHVPKLTTAVNDAQAVRDVMLSKYQFDRSRLVERYNDQATRATIINDLYQIAKRAAPEDSLLIYYAGHGFLDDTLNQGYWVPVDGEPGKIYTFVSNSDVRDALAGIQARHIWLVSDSCFSGSLLADRSLPGQIDERYYHEKYKLKSRQIMTSGGKEPVADQTGNRDCKGHSVFACYFIKYLERNEKNYLTPTEVMSGVAPVVANNSGQTPALGPLRNSGDELGEFVLIARAASVGLPPAGPPAAAPSWQAAGTSPIVAPKPMPAPMPRPAAGAREGMASIPAGCFMMGCAPGDDQCAKHEKPRHEVCLDAFYLDVCEVTLSKYRECESAGTCTSYKVRDEGIKGTAPTTGSWDDAKTYCAWAGKRLPTEAEWEYAARGGLDGKLYPWGNEKPLGRAAFVMNLMTKRWPVVASYPANGYGLYDMSGNINEWVNDWYSETYYSESPRENPPGPNAGPSRVLRGGAFDSGTDSLRVSNRDYRHPAFQDFTTGFRCAGD